MSYLGSSTRRVAVYGRRRNTRIVNHAPSLTTPDSDEGEPISTAPTPAPTPALAPTTRPRRTLGTWVDVASNGESSRPALGSRAVNATTQARKPAPRRSTRASHAGTSSDKENVPVLASRPRIPSGSKRAPSKRTPVVEVVIEHPPTADTSSSTLRSDGPSSDVILPRRRPHAKRRTRRIVETEDDSSDASDSDYAPTADGLAKRLAKVSLAPDCVVFPSPLSNRADVSELLATAGQEAPYAFATLIASLKGKRPIEKIGEASYSEVYKVDSGVVMKVIPIRGDEEEEEVPEASAAEDVQREVRITRALGGTKSFVSMRSAYVVGGEYPRELLDAWDRWDAKRRAKTGEGAENIRPDVLKSGQLYALLLLGDGGADLEHFRLRGWAQAAAVFWQVVQALAETETRLGFEHRDLHLGNVLVASVKRVEQVKSSPVRRTSQRSTRKSLPSYSSQPRWLTDADVQATIIDFTLSRLVVGKKETVAYQFQDESLFEGEGDAQFDVYRQMREHTGGEWEGFFPKTNVMWLRYLADKLLNDKGLVAPEGEGMEQSAYSSLLDAARWTLKHASASELLDRFNL